MTLWLRHICSCCVPRHCVQLNMLATVMLKNWQCMPSSTCRSLFAILIKVARSQLQCGSQMQEEVQRAAGALSHPSLTSVNSGQPSHEINKNLMSAPSLLFPGLTQFVLDKHYSLLCLKLSTVNHHLAQNAQRVLVVFRQALWHSDRWQLHLRPVVPLRTHLQDTPPRPGSHSKKGKC